MGGSCVVNVTAFSLVFIVELTNAGEISVEVLIEAWNVVITKRIRFAVLVYIIQLIVPHVSVVVQFSVHNSNPLESVAVLKLNICFIIIHDKPLKLALIYTACIAITQSVDECIEA
jgi:hypothetical protein